MTGSFVPTNNPLDIVAKPKAKLPENKEDVIASLPPDVLARLKAQHVVEMSSYTPPTKRFIIVDDDGVDVDAELDRFFSWSQEQQDELDACNVKTKMSSEVRGEDEDKTEVVPRSSSSNSN